MERRRQIIQDKYYLLDTLWSKGYKKRDKYSLSPTGKAHDENIIIKEINKNREVLFIKSGQDVTTFSKCLHHLTKPVKLLTTDGDGEFPKDYNLEYINKILSNDKISAWYIQNCRDILHPKIKRFPIGLDLHTLRWKIGNSPKDKVDFMTSLSNKNKKNSILIDFYCTKDRNKDRIDCLAAVEGLPHVDILRNRVSTSHLYQLYNNYRFVCSPLGAGLDCHRTWEVLLIGSIPIVKEGPLDTLYKDLPVVIVKDWSECTEENLNIWWQKYKHMTEKEYILPKFSYDYWIK